MEQIKNYGQIQSLEDDYVYLSEVVDDDVTWAFIITCSHEVDIVELDILHRIRTKLVKCQQILFLLVIDQE